MPTLSLPVTTPAAGGDPHLALMESIIQNQIVIMKSLQEIQDGLVTLIEESRAYHLENE